MPPALSGEDVSASSEDEQIPPRAKNESTDSNEDGGDDGEEADEDVYVVEKILSHRLKKNGTAIYEVKWQGYDDPKDRTWEPTDNLQGALDVLHEYWEDIGGNPEQGKAKGTKRKGRKSVTDSRSATPAAASKKIKSEPEWTPPPGSWEDDVNHIDTVEEQRDPTSGKMVKFAYIVWNNHRKTQHPLHHVYQKCPQKMLRYYEDHLVFNVENDLINGNGDIAVKHNMS